MPKKVTLPNYLFGYASRLMQEAGFNAYEQKELRGYYDRTINENCRQIMTFRLFHRLGSWHYSFSVGSRIEDVEEIVERFLVFGPEVEAPSFEYKMRFTIGTWGQSMMPPNRYGLNYTPADLEAVDRELPGAVQSSVTW